MYNHFVNDISWSELTVGHPIFSAVPTMEVPVLVYIWFVYLLWHHPFLCILDGTASQVLYAVPMSKSLFSNERWLLYFFVSRHNFNLNLDLNFSNSLSTLVLSGLVSYIVHLISGLCPFTKWNYPWSSPERTVLLIHVLPFHGSDVQPLGPPTDYDKIATGVCCFMLSKS